MCAYIQYVSVCVEKVPVTHLMLSVDRAFLIGGQLRSSNRSPYEDNSQEEEHSALLTALTIPCQCVFVSVCVGVGVCV